MPYCKPDSPWVCPSMQLVICQTDRLKTYSSLNLYWLEQVETLVKTRDKVYSLFTLLSRQWSSCFLYVYNNIMQFNANYWWADLLTYSHMDWSAVSTYQQDFSKFADIHCQKFHFPFCLNFRPEYINSAKIVDFSNPTKIEYFFLLTSFRLSLPSNQTRGTWGLSMPPIKATPPNIVTIQAPSPALATPNLTSHRSPRIRIGRSHPHARALNGAPMCPDYRYH